MPVSASVILASRNEGPLLRRTVDSMLNAACRISYEIIVVDDGSRDESSVLGICSSQSPVHFIRTPGLGVAPARNAGARLATGEMLVFCDAHITVPAGWLDQLARTIRDEVCDAVTPGIGPLDPKDYILARKIAASAPLNAVGCGRVFSSLIANTWLPKHDTPRECPILSGGCFAVKRRVWEQVGGYEDAFRGYGYDEEEISLKLWLFGYRLMTAPETVILHKFRAVAPYPIANEDFFHNRIYAAMCHFSNDRTERLLNHMRYYPKLGLIRHQVFTPENLKNKREAYMAARIYDDDWYFRKFSPHL